MCKSKYMNVSPWENFPVQMNPKTPLDVRNTRKLKSHLEAFPVFLFDDQRRMSAKGFKGTFLVASCSFIVSRRVHFCRITQPYCLQQNQQSMRKKERNQLISIPMNTFTYFMQTKSLYNTSDIHPKGPLSHGLRCGKEN